jgi:hypothetical protein
MRTMRRIIVKPSPPPVEALLKNLALNVISTSLIFPIVDEVSLPFVVDAVGVDFKTVPVHEYVCPANESTAQIHVGELEKVSTYCLDTNEPP